MSADKAATAATFERPKAWGPPPSQVVAMYWVICPIHRDPATGASTTLRDHPKCTAPETGAVMVASGNWEKIDEVGVGPESLTNITGRASLGSGTTRKGFRKL